MSTIHPPQHGDQDREVAPQAHTALVEPDALLDEPSSDKDILRTLISLSQLSSEEFDSQVALLNDPAADTDTLARVVGLSCLSQEAFDEALTQSSLEQGAAPAEPEIHLVSQDGLLPSRQHVLFDTAGRPADAFPSGETVSSTSYATPLPGQYPGGSTTTSLSDMIMTLLGVIDYTHLDTVTSLLLRQNAYASSDVVSLVIGLSTSLCERVGRFNELRDITAAIAMTERALSVVPDGDASAVNLLNNLGVSLRKRFDHLGEPGDLDRAIESQQRVVALTPDGHVEEAVRLSNLGGSLWSRFDHLGKLSDLEDAIVCLQKAVALTSDSHTHKATMLNNLGLSFKSRFDHFGTITDLEHAIECMDQVVAIPLSGHLESSSRLNNLGSCLLRRFGHLGELADLERATECMQQAVNLIPSSHPDRASPLNSLGVCYRNRFGRLGELSDLDCAIQYQQEAVSLTPDGNPYKAGWLTNLGVSLESRFGHCGELADLDHAIESQQRAVTLTPDDHAEKAGRLNNLGICLESRFGRLEELADLERAIECLQQAVALTADYHVDGPSRLNNLGVALHRRFSHIGKIADLNRAIETMQQAVNLTPDNAIDKAGRLSGLGTCLQDRFRHLREPSDLELALKCQQEAVTITPDDDPYMAAWLSNLGISLSRRFGFFGDSADLDRAIECEQSAVNLTPEVHADKAGRLINMGILLASRIAYRSNPSDLDRAASAFSQSAQSKSSSLSTRLDGARRWAHLCVTHRETLHPSAPLDAYTVLVDLVPRVTSLGRTISQRYNDMTASHLGGVISEAVGEAIRQGKPELALEWLEQGRSIIWSQILQLRSPIDDLRQKHPMEAKRLEKLSCDLEFAATSDSDGTFTGPRGVTDQSLEAAAQKHRRLGEEYERLLEGIRNFDGFDAFLRPKRFAALYKAASSGPIIVVNMDEGRCDALIVQPSSPNITHVPLPAIHSLNAQSLQRDLVASLRAADGLRFSMPYKHPWLKESGASQDKQFLGMLEQLWETIAEPILCHLRILEKPSNGELPHITWCVTGPLTFLPIHAAGRYREANGPRVFDFAVSSYTPTLTAILDRKNDGRAEQRGEKIRVLGVSQCTTPHLPPLPNTKLEIEKIQHSRLDLHCLNDKEATVDAVIDGMGRCNWVHLACHGTQNGTNSAFHLADGELTLKHIMKQSLGHAELAVLSACQTAMGDKQLPEEAIHLAAGMLIAGYGSVIATMWSIADKDGPIIAKELYEHLLKGDGDGTKVAYALHQAVKHLRQEVGETNFARWVPFIHLGI